MVEQSSQHKLAIVGGGLTGLSSAYFALKQGVPGDQIDIYEASHRLGGKIESGMLDGKVVNKGAEFIDSEQTELLALCRELNVPLVASKDQGDLVFRKPDGTRMEQKEFFGAYAPVSAVLARQKAELAANPNGQLAQQLNAMSLDQYVDWLGANLSAQENPSLMRRMWNALTFQSNKIDPQILEMARLAYASEAGQPPARISALQFVHEASANNDSIMASDCAFRVQEGTEQIIHTLRAHLEAAGVHIHQSAKVTSVAKTQNGVQLNFANGQSAASEKAIFALPAYGMAQVQGLDALGLSPQAAGLIANTQYTHNLKFTIKMKPGVRADNANYYADGYQSWSADEGQMTFLCNADAMQGRSVPQFIQACLEDYAHSRGTNAAALFASGPDSTVLTNPGAKPCYASPAPGQVLALDALGHSMDTLAANGVALAGTYLPHRTHGGMEIGFMNCGVNSAELATEHVLAPQPEKTNWLERMQTRQASRSPALAGAAL